MKTGIMGGTFDPIHIGHLILAEKAYEQFHLDRVLFIPAGNPPHKQNREGRATDIQRVEMVKLAIAGNPHFSLCLDEMTEEGYSYTYLTLERLKRANPDDEYYFIIGADSLRDFHTWREPARICAAAGLLAAVRDHMPKQEIEKKMNVLRKDYSADISLLEIPNMDVASHTIRSWIAEGKSIRYYLPDSVIQYIKNNRIYSEDKRFDGYGQEI